MSRFALALSRIAPLWNLEQFVAVNPFVGFTDRPFAQIMEERERSTGRAHLPGAAEPLTVRWEPDSPASLLGPFLASYWSSESTLLTSPWRNQGLWPAWKSSLPWSVALARKPARALASLVRTLPDAPSAALADLGYTDPDDPRLETLLAAVPGWASAVRTLEWPNLPTDDGPLVALAAMLAAVARVVPPASATGPAVPDSAPRLAQLELREAELRAQFRALIRAAAPLSLTPQAGGIRAAFCIDVRSEPFRRAWEAADSRVATDGFAGFFGLPLSWEAGDRRHHLPVLLAPEHTLRPSRLPRRRSVLASKGTPNFPLVELTGWAAGWKLLWRARAPKYQPMPDVEQTLEAVPLDDKVRWARALLKNLGWTDNWRPLMAFVGHGSTSVNNPHAAGLDCGACGGRTGELSARAAAALLNALEVRQALASQGIVLPEATRFVAGLHNTTVDSLTWFDEAHPEQVRSQLRQLSEGLLKAQRTAQAERARRFPFVRGASAARDEAETRPEAGLAGNAAFVAAPTALLQGSDFAGRAFLHSYDAERDHDGSVLELILTAPVVVATWINLQYFASAVTPSLYGGGNKVLHSRVGHWGVFEGNVADLRPGLPEQSVLWQSRPYHEPVRLQVLVVAPVQRVTAVLDRHPEVSALFDHGWADLSVREGSQWYRRIAGAWHRDPSSA